MTIKPLLLLLLCSAIFLSASAFTEEGHVLVLNKDNFDQAISSFENILVEFYAPWCGHCKRLEPEYARAAETLRDNGSKVRLAKVDADFEKELAQRFGINSFPTLIMFSNGELAPYNGGRTANAIVGWIVKRTEIPSVFVEKLEDLDTLVEKSDAIVVFLGDTFDRGFDLYRRIAARNMDIHFFHTTTPEIIEKYNADGEIRVVVLRNFENEDRKVAYQGSYNEAELEQFIMRNRYPRILPYNDKYAKVIFGDRNPALFLIAGKGYTTQKAYNAINEIADKIRDKILITVCNIEEEICQKVAKYLNLKKEDIPVISIIKPPKVYSAEKYIYEGKLSAAPILQFFEDYEHNRLTPLGQSEEIPDKNDDYVKTIVGATFKDIIYDENKDVLVFFSMTTSAECKEHFASFEGLARLLVPIQNLILGKIEADRNQPRGFNTSLVTGVPMILLFPHNDKQNPIAYTGSYEIKDMYEFFKDKFTVGFDRSLIQIDETLDELKKEAEEKIAAAERSRKKLEELDAANKAKEAAQAQAEFEAKLHAQAQSHQTSEVQDL